MSGNFTFPLQPTFNSLEGPFSNLAAASIKIIPHQPLQVSSSYYPCSRLTFGSVAWFQDCTMRRIRRSAGSVLARVATRSACRECYPLRTYSPHHPNAYRKSRSIPLLPDLLFHPSSTFCIPSIPSVVHTDWTVVRDKLTLYRHSP